MQRSALWSEVNTQVLDEFGRLDGFIKNYDRNNYIACISRKSLQQLIEAKFDILDKVRLIHTLNKIPVTLSIGCATGDEEFAAQAEQARLGLDLALGRGGDRLCRPDRRRNADIRRKIDGTGEKYSRAGAWLPKRFMSSSARPIRYW